MAHGPYLLPAWGLGLPLNPFPLPLEQAGEGEPWGLMTGAKALFCLTAGKTEEENGRMEDVLEDPTVGLDDMTGKQMHNLLLERETYGEVLSSVHITLHSY